LKKWRIVRSEDSSSLPEHEKEKAAEDSKSSQCFACGKSVADPKEANHLGDEVICDACREEMVASLEEAWVKHSAFLDSALN
jgi:hypothetical protein